MGCTDSREKKLTIPGSTDLENYVFLKQCELGLHKIKYHHFQAAIVRYGYKGIDLS